MVVGTRSLCQEEPSAVIFVPTTPHRRANKRSFEHNPSLQPQKNKAKNNNGIIYPGALLFTLRQNLLTTTGTTVGHVHQWPHRYMVQASKDDRAFPPRAHPCNAAQDSKQKSAVEVFRRGIWYSVECQPPKTARSRYSGLKWFAIRANESNCLHERHGHKQGNVTTQTACLQCESLVLSGGQSHSASLRQCQRNSQGNYQ